MLGKDAVHGSTTDPKSTGNLRGAEFFLRMQAKNFNRVYRRLPPSIDPSPFRCGDALKLTFAAEVCFKLREDAEHIEERFSSRASCVDRLLGGLQHDAVRLEIENDILQIFDATGKPIDSRDDKRISRPQEREEILQLRSAVAPRRCGLLRTHDVAAGGVERRLLDGEVLVDAGNASVTVESHGIVSLDSRPFNGSVSETQMQSYWDAKSVSASGLFGVYPSETTEAAAAPKSTGAVCKFSFT
jgi:hypothetical protein